ncbi:MAG: ArsR/SmtB family transcription factor [Lysobacter sp.]
MFRLLVEAGRDGRMAGDIAEALALPGATASFHFKELSAASLISGESRGRFICYTANFDAMNGLIEFLTRNCCGGDASQCPPADCAPAPKSAAKRKGAVAQ